MSIEHRGPGFSGAESQPETNPEIDSEQINQFILKLAESSDIKDEEAINAIANQIKLLENGKIALSGGKEILKNPKIKNIYFGGG